MMMFTPNKERIVERIRAMIKREGVSMKAAFTSNNELMRNSPFGANLSTVVGALILAVTATASIQAMAASQPLNPTNIPKYR